MKVIDAIKRRHSIRKFKEKSISNKLINKLLEAARLAPSGNNVQPWRFKVVKEKRIKDKLKEAKVFKQDFVYTAPLVFVCCADPNAYVKIKGWDAENRVRAIRDLSIACAFLVLRATELGLGCCFVGRVDSEKLKEILKIPKHYVLPYVIPVGYADEKPKRHLRKKLSEIILK